MTRRSPARSPRRYRAKPPAGPSSVEIAILGGERLVQDGFGQIDVVGDNDRSAHEAVDVADSVCMLVRRSEYGNRPAPLGDDHPVEFVLVETVEDVQALGLELRGADGLRDGHGSPAGHVS